LKQRLRGHDLRPAIIRNAETPYQIQHFAKWGRTADQCAG
jgi:hypothetical protein